ncbi:MULTISPECIES: hypothetical protein [Microvirga]|uniref:hypothetical protein n=1 Tax=Microvirga TaxID=186650 RepID=UPI0021C7154C|nr:MULTISPECIES: hypothetical protein [unclassified Microvirga]
MTNSSKLNLYRIHQTLPLLWILAIPPVAEAQDGLQTTPLQQVPTLPPGPPSGPQTAKGVADFLKMGLPMLNEYGLGLKISDQMTKLEPKILNDLKYAGNGGVLVVARLQSVQTDSGVYRSLISDRLDYVGIGMTPADAELSHTEHPDPFYVMDQGKRLDAEASLAYWFRKNPDGSITVTHQPLSMLRRAMFGLHAERNLAKYSWSAARGRELERLVKELSASVDKAEVRSKLEEMASSRAAALTELNRLNEKLRVELERARQSAESMVVLDLLYKGASFASFVQRASEGLSASDQSAVRSQSTRDGVLAELDAINKRAKSSSDLIKEEIRVQSNISNNVETQAIFILREYNVPVENLPPSDSPTIVPDPN